MFSFSQLLQYSQAYAFSANGAAANDLLERHTLVGRGAVGAVRQRPSHNRSAYIVHPITQHLAR